MKYSKHFMNSKIEQRVATILTKTIQSTSSTPELSDFLNDLLSPAEKSMLAKRIAIAFMIMENKYSYEEIIKTLKVSDGTVAKVNAILTLKGNGFRKTIGNLVLKKDIQNTLSEFLDLVTPDKRNLTGEKYLKPKFESRIKREEPL